MDREEFVEKVTRRVIEVLDDMNKVASTSNNDTVKIWPHQSPLPEPVELSAAKPKQPKNINKLVNITPYVKNNNQ